jgi:hypothetical protein
MTFCYIFKHCKIKNKHKIIKVTDKNVQKEIDINTEVLGIVNGEIVKVTDKNVQKEIDINTEVTHTQLGSFFKFTLYKSAFRPVHLCLSLVCIMLVVHLPN